MEITSDSQITLLLITVVNIEKTFNARFWKTTKILAVTQSELLRETKIFKPLQFREEKRVVPNHNIHLVHYLKSIKLQLWRWKGWHLLLQEYKLKSVSTKHRNIWKGCLSDSGPRLFNNLPRNLCDTTNC